MIQAGMEAAKILDQLDTSEVIERIEFYTTELAARLAAGDDFGALRILTRLRAVADIVGRECIARMLRVSEQGATS